MRVRVGACHHIAILRLSGSVWVSTAVGERGCMETEELPAYSINSGVDFQRLLCNARTVQTEDLLHRKRCSY